MDTTDKTLRIVATVDDTILRTCQCIYAQKGCNVTRKKLPNLKRFNNCTQMVIAQFVDS